MSDAMKPTDAQATSYAPAKGWNDRAQGAAQDPDGVRASGTSVPINTTGAANGHGFGQFGTDEHNGVGGYPGTSEGHGSLVPGNDGDGDDSNVYSGPAQSGAGR